VKLVSTHEAIVLSAFKGREQVQVPDLPLTGKEYRQAVTALVQRGWLKNSRLPLTLTKSLTLKAYLKAEHSKAENDCYD